MAPEIIYTVASATAFYLLGQILALIDRKMRKKDSIADRELDTVVSLIAFGVMLFSVADSLN